MDFKFIKELRGNSKSKIFLLKNKELIFIRKIGDIDRNLERFEYLSNLNLNFPKIYRIDKNFYDMEFIHSINIKKYLSTNEPIKLINFIIQTIDQLSSHNKPEVDFSETYLKKLQNFDFKKYPMPFSLEELFVKLPKKLPFTHYHGDLTLENILYDYKKDKFFLIDPLTTDYSSFIFDLAKLNQDLICKWFIRNEDYYDFNLTKNLGKIQESIKYLMPNGIEYLSILMLMRVVPYCCQKDIDFLTKEIYKLWK
jgi:hypothetical protein